MRKFLLLWSGEFISAIGSGLTSFGLGVYVYQQTGKASAMTLVTLLAFLPSLLLGAPAGVLADRYDRRLLMILGDSLSAIGLIYILLCLFQGKAALWQICLGVLISSVFSSLLDPAYRATVTDLVDEEQYTKANGLMQIAANSKYLISPILAGILLTTFDIKLLLLIDISTFFITVFTTFVVKQTIAKKKENTMQEKRQIEERNASFLVSLKNGWLAIAKNRGVFVLVIMTAVLTMFLGIIETLSLPMLLSFTNSGVVGMIETAVATGLLVSSILIGIFSIKKNHVKVLSLSLCFDGVFMMLFGLQQNLILICISGFMFFAMLPFANSSLDYLVRTNIDNAIQGRVWGFIGVVSQLGFVLAYAFSGLLADYVFTPLLMPQGALASSVGRVIGVGPGRGIGLLIMMAGFCLCMNSLLLYRMKSVRSLEQ